MLRAADAAPILMMQSDATLLLMLMLYAAARDMLPRAPHADARFDIRRCHVILMLPRDARRSR